MLLTMVWRLHRDRRVRDFGAIDTGEYPAPGLTVSELGAKKADGIYTQKTVSSCAAKRLKRRLGQRDPPRTVARKALWRQPRTTCFERIQKQRDSSLLAASCQQPGC